MSVLDIKIHQDWGPDGYVFKKTTDEPATKATLAEAAMLSQDELTKGVIDSIVSVNQMFEQLPFEPIPGGDLSYTRRVTLPGKFEDVDGHYTYSAGPAHDMSQEIWEHREYDCDPGKDVQTITHQYSRGPDGPRFNTRGELAAFEREKCKPKYPSLTFDGEMSEEHLDEILAGFVEVDSEGWGG